MQVGIHDRGLGLHRPVVARRIAGLEHLQSRLGSFAGDSRGIRQKNQNKGCRPRYVLHEEVSGARLRRRLQQDQPGLETFGIAVFQGLRAKAKMSLLRGTK